MADQKKSFLQEVNVTVKRVSDFWPDFCITKEKILHPTADYVISFYKRFLTELKAQVQSVQPEGDSRDEPEEMENLAAFGGEVPLYVELVKIYNRFGSIFYLSDLYEPQPKRTRFFFEVAVHYLAFVNNNMEDLSNLAEASLQKIAETKHLRTLEQQLLQNSAENAENISRMLDTNQKLKIKSEKIDLEYKNMMKVKSEEDKRYNDKVAFKKNQETELDNLEFKLQYAENKEKELQECVVTEEDFENMKKTEEFLTNGLEQMKSKYNEIDAELQVKTTYKAYKEIEEHQATLEHLNYGDFHILSTLHDHMEKKKVAKSENVELLTNRETLHKKKADIIDSVNMKKQVKEEGKILNSEFLTETAIDVEKANKRHKEVQQRFQEKCLNQKLLLCEISQEEENIKTLDEQAKFVKNHADMELQKMLNPMDTTTTKFKTLLEFLKNTQI